MGEAWGLLGVFKLLALICCIGGLFVPVVTTADSWELDIIEVAKPGPCPSKTDWALEGHQRVLEKNQKGIPVNRNQTGTGFKPSALVPLNCRGSFRKSRQVEQGTLLHFQWTGSDANNNNNAGNGRAGTDRSNLVQADRWLMGGDPPETKRLS